MEDDRERTVTNLRKGALTLAAVAGAALLLDASPAWADDEDDAKDACKRIAENRDWDDTEAKVTKENDNRIVVTMTGERNNNDKERRCVYNSNSKEARFVED